MGRFFLRMSLMLINVLISQPIMPMPAHALKNTSNKDILKQGYGLSRITMLPRDYGRLELGTRWFDQKINLRSGSSLLWEK